MSNSQKNQPVKFSLFCLAFSVLALANVGRVAAQTGPAIEWQQSFGGSYYEECSIVRQTVDGGYILGGYSGSEISGNKTSANYGGNDYWVVKLDNSGNKVWEKSFGGRDHDYLQSLQQTSDGGYILGGNSRSIAFGNKTSTYYGVQDYWVVKLDSSGNKVWDNSYGGSDTDSLNSLHQTSDGGYILGGHSHSIVSGNKTSANYGGSDYWVVKIDASGNKLWENSIGGSGSDGLLDLQRTSDDGYILGGSSRSDVSGNKTSANYGGSDSWVVKIDASGNKVWEQSFGGSGNDTIFSVQQTSDGGYILGGYSNSGISGNKTSDNHGIYDDYWVVKIDANGNKIWDKSFGGNTWDRLYSLQQTSDGGYILGGSSRSSVSGNKTSVNYGATDYWLVKLDSSGSKVWEKSFGGTDFDDLFSLQQTSDGGYILGGYSYSGISGNKSTGNYGGVDYWIVKLAADPPSFSSITAMHGNVNLTWQTLPGKTYRVQGNDNLSQTNWTTIGSDMPAVGGSLSITNTPSGNQRFYRIVQVD